MKRKITLVLLLAIMAISLFTVQFNAFAEENASDIPLTSASKEALLMTESGEVLYGHDITVKRPIASMTKIMTLLCVYDSIEQGKLSLDDSVTISENASSMGGSQVFLDAHTQHKASNLIKSIVVCSANDSCVALAEHISGSVDNFVKLMNERAEKMQLVATHFNNCTGLPTTDHYSCALDVANMMRELVKHPHYLQCAGVWMEDYAHPDGRVTGMTNTNKLIKFYQGCDGGKTGFTNEAMHCLCATAKRGDTRMFAVVVGAPDSKTRFAEVSAMFNYAFANYETKVFLSADNTENTVAVIGGKSDSVQIVPKNTLALTCKKGQASQYQVIVECAAVKAPVLKGQVVGSANVVNEQGEVVLSTEMVVNQDVLSKSYFDYLDQIILGK